MLSIGEMFCEGENETESGSCHKGNISRYLVNFSADIGLTENEIRELMEAQLRTGAQKVVHPVSTSSIKLKNHLSPETIIFHDPTKRCSARSTDHSHSGSASTKTRVPGSSNVITANSVLVDIDLKKVRQEVRRFGIKGLEQTDKQSALADMLIKLGAKPPKKSFVNYKQFIASKKAHDEKLRSLKSSKFYDSGKLRAITRLNQYKKRDRIEKKMKQNTTVHG